MPEIIDPVFAKTSQNARFLLSENERFGLVFVKTGSINSGTGDAEAHPALGQGGGGEDGCQEILSWILIQLQTKPGMLLRENKHPLNCFHWKSIGGKIFQTCLVTVVYCRYF